MPKYLPQHLELCWNGWSPARCPHPFTRQRPKVWGFKGHFGGTFPTFSWHTAFSVAYPSCVAAFLPSYTPVHILASQSSQQVVSFYFAHWSNWTTRMISLIDVSSLSNFANNILIMFHRTLRTFLQFFFSSFILIYKDLTSWVAYSWFQMTYYNIWLKKVNYFIRTWPHFRGKAILVTS